MWNTFKKRILNIEYRWKWGLTSPIRGPSTEIPVFPLFLNPLLVAHKFRRDIVLEKLKICLKALPFVIPVRMMLKAHLLYLNKEEKKYEGWEKRDPEESSWYRNDLERRRKELINKIREEAGTSSLKESFYEAFGQSLRGGVIIKKRKNLGQCPK